MGGSSSKSTPLSPNQLMGYNYVMDVSTGGKLGEFQRKGTAPVEYQKDGTVLDYKPIANDVSYDSVAYSPVAYNPVSAADIRALGGAGATRELSAARARQMAIDEMAADPRLSSFMRNRVAQGIHRDYQGNMDAIGKEVEAAITGLKADQAAKLFDAQAGQAAKLFDAQAGQAATRLNTQMANRAFAAEQAAKAFDAQQMNRSFSADQAAREYAARVRNSNLSREDMLAIANIYFGGKGQTTTQSTSGLGTILDGLGTVGGLGLAGAKLFAG